MIKHNHSIRVVQLNMNDQHVVVKQLRDYCIVHNVGVSLAQDPPSSFGKIKGLDHSPIRIISFKGKKSSIAAIVVFDTNLDVIEMSHLISRYFAVVTITPKVGRPLTVVLAYFKFSVATAAMVNELDNIMGSLGMEVLVACDLNAHSKLWHQDSRNHAANTKGKQVVELIDNRNLVVHNLPNMPYTYHRTGMGETNIDVTLTINVDASRYSQRRISEASALIGFTDAWGPMCRHRTANSG